MFFLVPVSTKWRPGQPPCNGRPRRWGWQEGVGGPGGCDGVRRCPTPREQTCHESRLSLPNFLHLHADVLFCQGRADFDRPQLLAPDREWHGAVHRGERGGWGFPGPGQAPETGRFEAAKPISERIRPHRVTTARSSPTGNAKSRCGWPSRCGSGKNAPSCRRLG